MSALKKCPFCGSGVAKIKVGSTFMWEHAIVCADCGASTKLMGGITPSIARDRANKAWNNRATEAEIRNKAIDEFTEKLKVEFVDFKKSTDIITLGTCIRLINSVAEKLKEQ